MNAQKIRQVYFETLKRFFLNIIKKIIKQQSINNKSISITNKERNKETREREREKKKEVIHYKNIISYNKNNRIHIL